MADSAGAVVTQHDKNVRLTRGGLVVGDREVPLFAGSLHYWRLDPKDWSRALSELARLGCTLVDTYVPWAVHERSAGAYDFGERRPELDLGRFFTLVREAGLWCSVRPGPHVNAELTYFGIPERVVWDRACQALSPRGSPVVLPVPPRAFPVPSYASRAFLRSVAGWFDAVAPRIARACFPDGPVVLVQVDNEGAYYFRDGVYDQDHHPDALVQYRRFLARRYESLTSLSAAYARSIASFERVVPPHSMTARTPAELREHLDWAEFQEVLLCDSLAHMSDMLRERGIRGVPLSHNLPPMEHATPLDPASVAKVVDLVGTDYYHGASEAERTAIARRTTELVTRSDVLGVPPFASELGAGFPPFFPVIPAEHSAFTALAAFAYGLSAFNIYMAVDRDRWVGAPLSVRGEPRPFAEFWRRLIAAIARTRLVDLRRRVEVVIFVPRSLRRLNRVLHAFGPLSAAALAAGGGGAELSLREDDFGLGGVGALEAEEFARGVATALDHRSISYAFAGADLLSSELTAKTPSVVICPGVLETTLIDALRARRNTPIIGVGPLWPERTAAWERAGFEQPGPETATTSQGSFVRHWRTAAQALEQLLAALATGAAARPHVAPETVSSSVFEDGARRPKVAFLINPGVQATPVRFSLPGLAAVTDALSGENYRASSSEVSLTLAACSVRMLELDVEP
jgi:beta-galactosidase